MVFVAIGVASLLFAVAFRFLLLFWGSLRGRGRRTIAHLLLAIGFLIAYFGYSIGYLTLTTELIARFPDVRRFGDWPDDLATVIPFLIAIAMMVRTRQPALTTAV